jgi:hypothetical protein
VLVIVGALQLLLTPFDRAFESRRWSRKARREDR